MDNKKFIIQDRFGIKLDAELIMRFNVNEIEYILYSIDKDEQNVDVYVGRLIYDQNGNEMILSISDREEEEKIFSIVDKMINKVRWMIWIINLKLLFRIKKFLMVL